MSKPLRVIIEVKPSHTVPSSHWYNAYLHGSLVAQTVKETDAEAEADIRKEITRKLGADVRFSLSYKRDYDDSEAQTH